MGWLPGHFLASQVAGIALRKCLRPKTWPAALLPIPCSITPVDAVHHRQRGRKELLFLPRLGSCPGTTRKNSSLSFRLPATGVAPINLARRTCHRNRQGKVLYDEKFQNI